jgi:hypothetical protein
MWKEKWDIDIIIADSNPWRANASKVYLEKKWYTTKIVMLSQGVTLEVKSGLVYLLNITWVRKVLDQIDSLTPWKVFVNSCKIDQFDTLFAKYENYEQFKTIVWNNKTHMYWIDRSKPHDDNSEFLDAVWNSVS